MPTKVFSLAAIVRPHRGVIAIAVMYLIVAGAYSRLTGAWEANDEMHHVANTEYILQHRELFPLRFGSWHETHQPPLYYLIAALWQRSLGIPGFRPEDPEPTRPTVNDDPVLVYTHRYNDRAERAAAKAVHKLRFLSIVCGLGTVVLTYAAARFVIADRGVAVASAAFVALLPKFDVVSSSFTNDALVVMLCSLALVLTLAFGKASERSRKWIALALGLTAGAAVITKLNSIPVLAVLLASVVIVSPRNAILRIRDAALAAAGFVITGGWWFVRNLLTGRDLLGQSGVTEWLNEVLPGNIAIVPWTDSERFLNFVPARLVRSSWYQGGWNQFFAPFGLNFTLSILALIALFCVAKRFLIGGRYVGKQTAPITLLMLTTAAAFATVIIIAKTTSQAEGRIAYVGLSAFAILCVVGICEAFAPSVRWQRLAIAFWPATLLLFNAYVFLRFVWPFRAF